MSDYVRSLNKQYGHQELEQRILEGLKASGCNLDDLSCDDLAPIDHFHIRGKPASLELARLAGIQSGLKVLDVGGGIGGSARMLANEFGCQVTVLDITQVFCDIGTMLTARTGLKDRVDFQQGDAMTLPFPDNSFDIVWTQHSSMNIPDKPRMYQEVRRVLNADGRLAMYEIMAGAVTPVLFPVPFAADDALSFLLPPNEVCSIIEKSGFNKIKWQDVTTLSMKWYTDNFSGFSDRAANRTPLPSLGLHLLFGDHVYEIMRNFIPNLEENRMTVIAAVFDKINQ